MKVSISTNFSEIRVTFVLLHNKNRGQFKQGVPPRLQEIEPTIWLFVWIWKATNEFFYCRYWREHLDAKETGEAKHIHQMLPNGDL